ncbi:hypothetical protein ABS71_06370 [bacterium SCN 62-11]|nr:MAG: hypothetical protein ABS71_06370 [bacterium SCN 62-11]
MFVRGPYISFLFRCSPNPMLPGLQPSSWLSPAASNGLQLGLSTLVLFWAGRDIFQRAGSSLASGGPLSMFTLVALGSGIAYLYSLLATFGPQLFAGTGHHHDRIPLYYESAATIIVIVLLGQALERSARRQTFETLPGPGRQASRSPQTLVDRVSGQFIGLVLLVSILTFFAWLFLGPEPRLSHAVLQTVSVLVIACPCALGLAIPMALKVGAGIASRLDIRMNEIRALEILSTIQVFVTDQTMPEIAGTASPRWVELPSSPNRKASIEDLRGQGLRVALVSKVFEVAQSVDLQILLGSDLPSFSIGGPALSLGGGRPTVAKAYRLSRAVMATVRQNLFFAFFYNALGVLVAAGVLYPRWGILLNPMVASATMSLSSLCIVLNALRLKYRALD